MKLRNDCRHFAGRLNTFGDEQRSTYSIWREKNVLQWVDISELSTAELNDLKQAMYSMNRAVAYLLPFIRYYSVHLRAIH